MSSRAMAEYPLILVDAHEIKPIVLLGSRLEKFDFSVTKRPEQTLVPNVAHAIEGQLCVSFLQEDGLDLDIVRFESSSIVVDQARCLE